MDLSHIKAVIFDLDGTLAESKSPLDFEMASLLHELLGIVKVAVISGGDWPQFEKQLLSNLPHDELLMELSLLPTIKFKDIKEDLLKALNDIDLNIEDKNLHPGEPLELLEGFLNPLIPGEIHDYFRVTKTTLPMIMLLGKRTHRIYFFSLMRLLPDLDF